MNLSVYVYGDRAEASVNKAIKLVEEKGASIVGDPASADVAIAPMLQQFLTMEELEAPRYGTLIFHPSLLPRHRGPDAQMEPRFSEEAAAEMRRTLDS